MVLTTGSVDPVSGNNNPLIRILVINDDQALIDQLKAILEPERFEVFSTNPGNGIVETAMRSQPDVVILDLAIPDSDGWNTCRTLRESSSVPILVLSALNNPELLTQALDAGADDFLVRPVQNGILVAHVRTLARRASAENKATAAKQFPK